MKKLITLALVLGLSFSMAMAQEESNTLFKNVKKGKVGYIFEPNFSIGSLSDANLFLNGLRVGVLFDDKISFGAFYRYTLNNPIPSAETLPAHYTPFESGGGFLEYTLHSDKLFHLTFPLFFGFGELQTDHEDFSPELGETNFFILEPGVMVEVNILKEIRLNAGILYGFTGNFNYRFLDQSDLQGLRFQMGLKAGLFRK